MSGAGILEDRSERGALAGWRIDEGAEDVEG
jgi:hypothetical protein